MKSAIVFLCGLILSVSGLGLTNTPTLPVPPFTASQCQSANATSIFSNMNLIIGMVPQPPYVIPQAATPEQMANGHTQQFDGWFVNFMNQFCVCAGCNADNITYVEVETFDSGINMVASQQIDLLAISTITAERSQRIAFSQPYVQNALVVAANNNDPPEGLNFDFFSPFTWETWVFTALTVVSYAPVIWCLEGSQNIKRKRNDTTYKGRRGLGNATFDSVSAFLGQGPAFIPRTFLGRLFSSCFYFVSLVVIATYTAQLSAQLTNSEENTAINGVEDFQTRFVGVTADTAIANFVAQNNLAGDLFQAANFDQLTQALIDGVVEGIIEESTTLEIFLLNEPFCNVEILGQTFNPSGWGLSFRDPDGLDDGAVGVLQAHEASRVILNLRSLQTPANGINMSYFELLDSQWIIPDPRLPACNDGNIAVSANIDGDSTDSRQGVQRLGGLFFLFGIVAFVVCCVHLCFFIGRNYFRKYQHNGWELVCPWQLPDWEPEDDENEEDEDNDDWWYKLQQ